MALKRKRSGCGQTYITLHREKYKNRYCLFIYLFQGIIHQQAQEWRRAKVTVSCSDAIIENEHLLTNQRQVFLIPVVEIHIE